jgi:hypothetical protein
VSAERRRAALELGAVALLLAILAAALYGPQAIHGGFLSDAWSNRALFVFSESHGFFGKIGDLLSKPNIAVRPLQAVYLVVLNSVFGSHVGYWLTWQVFTNVVMCLTLYLLLRRLSLSAIEAGTVAVLVLLFPAASSIRFWLATIWAPLSLSMVCGGFLLALSAFEAESRRRALILHAISLALFVASILLYEVALLVMLASVLVYRLRVPWRPAIQRWVVDCAVLIAVTLTVTLSSEAGHESTEAGLFSHAKTIAEQAKVLFTTTVLPLNSGSWWALVLFALVPAVALGVYRLLPAASAVRPELRRWLLAMLGGLLVAGLGYVIYAPGTDYYIPLGPGIVNRVNAVPSIGWALILYAGAMLAATLALRELPRARLWASIVASAACALIAVGWVKSISTYSDYFTRAYEEDVRVLDKIETALPQPRSRSTIWTFGQPVEIVPGVPVFGNTWDMTSSVQLTYDDPTITSLVASPGTVFHCSPAGVLPSGSYAQEDGSPNPLFASPYGRTYFVETASGKAIAVKSRKQCRQAIKAFPLSPPYAG